MAGALVYLDSSAIVKLVVEEKESRALRTFLEGSVRRLSSGMARVEVQRAIRRAALGDAALRRAGEVLEGLDLVELDADIARVAAFLDPPALRSLDAIHLASALALGSDLSGFVAYDERLLAAARHAGLSASSPR